MECKKIDFTRHANEQMFARAITVDDVIKVINNGEPISSYPDDRPYPSYLLLYFIGKRPIHIVIAVDNENQNCIIIAAYEPSRAIWEDDFITRK